MKLSTTEAPVRNIAKELAITDLLSDPSFKFDLVVAELDGIHPAVRNDISDRAYFFLEGEAHVNVDNRTYHARKDDLIKIPAGTVHALEGKAKYLIITSPPFDPQNESVLE